MPPRLPSTPNLSQSRRKRALELFFCPSCSICRLAEPPSTPTSSSAHKPQHPALQRQRYNNARARHASTVASATAINAPVEVPPRLRELYQALDGLKGAAGSYVNLSRLQLALKGLEGGNPVVRVAVLSLNDRKAARQLVRLLLADPLAPRAGWEKSLEDGADEDGRGLLLRYGDEADIGPPDPLLRRVPIPSRVLQKNNLEIFISTLNINVSGPGGAVDTDRPQDAILVPLIQPPDATGRFTTVTYPVHKALVFGDGLDSALAYGRYTAGEGSDMPADMVKLAVGLPAPRKEPEQSASGTCASVDVDTAAEALAKFRESIANSVVYERGWFRSGVPVISDWLSAGAKPSETFVNPAVKSLITSLLSDTSKSITLEDAQRLRDLLAASIPASTTHALLDALRVWSEHAHAELRDSLDVAFAGRAWRRLRWWKLFWRVDDVSMIASEILERRWLVDAEKGVIWIAGRIEEAGFFTGAGAEGERASLRAPDVPFQPTFGKPPEKLKMRDLVQRDLLPLEDDQFASAMPALKPWPLQIPLARRILAIESVPRLQALAQKLMLQTLSTTSLTAALSALMYVSISTTSVFEAGAVAALGFVWSLRRMQRRWEDARRFWEGEVREEGRKALKETEERVRSIVERKGVPAPDPEGAEDRRVAREAVARAEEALARLER